MLPDRPSPPALRHEPVTVSLLYWPVNSQDQVGGTAFHSGQTGGAVCACPQVPTGPVLRIPSRVKAGEATTQACGQCGSTPRQAEVAGAELTYGSASVDPGGHGRCTGVYLHCLTCSSMAWMRNEW